MIKKPTTLNEYSTWCLEEFGVEILAPQLRNHYEIAADKLKKDIGRSAFWSALTKSYKEVNDQYKFDKKYQLFLEVNDLNLLVKPYESLLIKSFRKNILDNSLFPNPPSMGWILPSNWFENVHDIVRTSCTVRYLDGVEFWTEKIKEESIKLGKKLEIDFEARENGYYAAHISVKEKLSLTKIDFAEQEIDFTYEIQVTTQLQENIKMLLHKFYERNRIEFDLRQTKWQWDYKSDEFKSNYLGHILHYIEGMILELRDKKN